MKPTFRELWGVGEEVYFSNSENERRENNGMVTVENHRIRCMLSTQVVYSCFSTEGTSALCFL